MKTKEGISLIVLVITIIVVIIIASAVILSLAKNNPINEACIAVLKSNADSYNSQLKLVISAKYLDYHTFDLSTFNATVWNGDENNVTGTIKEYINNITVEDGLKYEIQAGKLVYVGNVQEEKDELSEMGIASSDPIPQGLGINTIATQNKTVDGKTAAYNDPIIPKGFKAVEYGAVWPSDWNKGLVIEDSSGNQFVWVPVDGSDVNFLKWCTSGNSYTVTTEDSLPSGISDQSSQVTKYGGFYIARYEAGKEATDVLVSKKNAVVWNSINYTDAKAKAEVMYTTNEVKSGLITGTQWDTVMSWVQNSRKKCY